MICGIPVDLMAHSSANTNPRSSIEVEPNRLFTVPAASKRIRTTCDGVCMEGARDAKGLATVINASLMQAFAISCLFNCCSALRTVYMEGIGQRQRAVFQRCTGNFTVVVYAH